MIEKLAKKRSTYSLIDDRSSIYVLSYFLSSSSVELNSNLKNYGHLATGEGRITELRKPNKKSIIYDQKSVIGSKNWLLKTDQSIIIENWFLIGTTIYRYGERRLPEHIHKVTAMLEKSIALHSVSFECDQSVDV